MIIVLIRRFVKPDKEQAFLASYKAQKPIDNPAFKGETLTRISDNPNLPSGLRSLALNGPACVTYLNIATWESWEAFADQFDVNSPGFDPEIETTARQRTVLDIVVGSSAS